MQTYELPLVYSLARKCASLGQREKKKLASGCDVGHKYVPEASGQDELPRDPFEQVQTRVRPAREKGELLLEILTMRMTVVLAGEMFRGSEDQPECSRLQSLLRQPKVFGRCR